VFFDSKRAETVVRQKAS